MAREIVVKNSRLFKRPLPISQLIESIGCGYGVMDEHFRLSLNEMSNDGPFVIFDKQHIGRGVQILGWDNRKEIRLRLTTPSTKYDVDLFYTFAKEIASHWKSKTIVIDETTISFSDIDKYREADYNMNINVLSKASSLFNSSSPTLYCAFFPISISVEQLQACSSDYDSFAHLLHEKQSLFPFFSRPMFITLGEEETSSVYTVIEDGYFILPKVAEMKYTEDGVEQICSTARVVITNLFPDEEISKMDFNQFMASVPDNKKSEFDSKGILVQPLSEAELRQIFRPNK